VNKKLLHFYKRHVTENLLPFWKNALDVRRGGVYTCFNNGGDRLVSNDKYTWSQGRFLWLWSEVARLAAKGKLDEKQEPYLTHLSKTAAFLEENVFLENGNCAFLLTEEGRKKESIPGEGYDTSLYADCFVALGLGKFAGLTGDIPRFDRTLALYERIRQRIDSGNIRTEPYPVPQGYRAHSIPMIMLNVAQELAAAAGELDHPGEEELLGHSISYMRDVMDNFYRGEDHGVAEMLPDNPSSEGDTLLSRHRNPGHTIESMWFVIHTARQTGHSRYLERAVMAIEKAVDIGWDPDYGGLLRFTDREGGKPCGSKGSSAYEQLIADSWDMKLWWPHSEALYATLLGYTQSGNRRLLQHYEKMEGYVFETFPHPDEKIDEWIQIRDRAGKPIDKIAALPVKDPFHILRNMLLIIDLLEDADMDQ